METLSSPWEIGDLFSARSGRRCSKSEATSSLPIADGAYSAPISPETRENAAVRVGTQQEENPMGTKLVRMAGYG